ncbi:hypothetical protein RBSH_01617 [Rhodopirellula baltica SH28]|uniref:Uncharacterized protein n=1 Tax=Rhodopirellula baltica SH28 TaxID=993517 RepID=K5DJ94_RHOBT|nr:hypothetical protein [Rhodopirellula baltica]EKK02924.1 hypothetical protein RBSH_01617 [Rhodopirellula baltica SH28]
MKTNRAGQTNRQAIKDGVRKNPVKEGRQSKPKATDLSVDG